MPLSKIPAAALGTSAGILTWSALTNSGSASPWVKLCTVNGNQNDRGSILLNGSSSYSAGDDNIAGGATISYTIANDAVANNLNLQVINSSSQFPLVVAAYAVRGATDYIWDVWVQVTPYSRINALAFGNLYTITSTYTDVTTTTKPTGGYDKKVGRAVTSLTPGAVLQVLQAVKTDTAVVSAGVTFSIASVVITPSSASSKFLLMSHVTGYALYDTCLYFKRSGTPIGQGDAAGSRGRGFSEMNGSPRSNEAGSSAGFYLDSPNTASQITYEVVLYNQSATAYINRSAVDDNNLWDSRNTSTLTVMEIAG